MVRTDVNKLGVIWKYFLLGFAKGFGIYIFVILLSVLFRFFHPVLLVVAAIIAAWLFIREVMFGYAAVVKTSKIAYAFTGMIFTLIFALLSCILSCILLYIFLLYDLFYIFYIYFVISIIAASCAGAVYSLPLTIPYVKKKDEHKKAISFKALNSLDFGVRYYPIPESRYKYYDITFLSRHNLLSFFIAIAIWLCSPLLLIDSMALMLGTLLLWIVFVAPILGGYSTKAVVDPFEDCVAFYCPKCYSVFEYALWYDTVGLISRDNSQHRTEIKKPITLTPRCICPECQRKVKMLPAVKVRECDLILYDKLGDFIEDPAEIKAFAQKLASKEQKLWLGERKHDPYFKYIDWKSIDF